MKEMLCRLPKALQTHIQIRFLLGSVCLVLTLAILILFGDLVFAFPCLVLAVFLFINGIILFYNGYNGNFVCIRGVCEQIEKVGIRKWTKSIGITFNGNLLRIPVRQRMKSLSVGDTVIVYLSEKTPVYEQNGEYMVCSYYAMVRDKGEKMEANKETLEKLLEEIGELVKKNVNEDGSFKFDVVRAVVALDFAKTEIEKTIMH